jgi:hypothetical protein
MVLVWVVAAFALASSDIESGMSGAKPAPGNPLTAAQTTVGPSSGAALGGRTSLRSVAGRGREARAEAPGESGGYFPEKSPRLRIAEVDRSDGQAPGGRPLDASSLNPEQRADSYIRLYADPRLRGYVDSKTEGTDRDNARNEVKTYRERLRATIIEYESTEITADKTEIIMRNNEFGHEEMETFKKLVRKGQELGQASEERITLAAYQAILAARDLPTAPPTGRPAATVADPLGQDSQRESERDKFSLERFFMFLGNDISTALGQGQVFSPGQTPQRAPARPAEPLPKFSNAVLRMSLLRDIYNMEHGPLTAAQATEMAAIMDAREKAAGRYSRTETATLLKNYSRLDYLTIAAAPGGLAFPGFELVRADVAKDALTPESLRQQVPTVPYVQPPAALDHASVSKDAPNVPQKRPTSDLPPASPSILIEKYLTYVIDPRLAGYLAKHPDEKDKCDRYRADLSHALADYYSLQITTTNTVETLKQDRINPRLIEKSQAFADKYRQDHPEADEKTVAITSYSMMRDEQRRLSNPDERRMSFLNQPESNGDYLTHRLYEQTFGKLDPALKAELTAAQGGSLPYQDPDLLDYLLYGGGAPGHMLMAMTGRVDENPSHMNRYLPDFATIGIGRAVPMAEPPPTAPASSAPAAVPTPSYSASGRRPAQAPSKVIPGGPR